MARRRTPARELTATEAEEEGFLRAIAQAPGEAAPRLIYADWLDERGDEAATRRAAFLRVECELREANYGTRRRQRLRDEMTRQAGELDAPWLRRVRRPRVRDWPGRPPRRVVDVELYGRRYGNDPASDVGGIGCLVGLVAAVAAGLFLGPTAETALGFLGVAFAACFGLVAACRRPRFRQGRGGRLVAAAAWVGGAVLAAVQRPEGAAWWMAAWIFGPIVVAILLGVSATLLMNWRRARARN